MSEVRREAPKGRPSGALRGKVIGARQIRCMKVKDQVMFSLFFSVDRH
jgi:hypothetical protein